MIDNCNNCLRPVEANGMRIFPIITRQQGLCAEGREAYLLADARVNWTSADSRNVPAVEADDCRYARDPFTIVWVA